MSVLTQNEFQVDQDVQKGSLTHLHRRLEHLHYDMIISMAKDPASDVLLADEVRSNCFTLAQGKQTKNNQSRDTEEIHR